MFLRLEGTLWYKNIKIFKDKILKKSKICGGPSGIFLRQPVRRKQSYIFWPSSYSQRSRNLVCGHRGGSAVQVVGWVHVQEYDNMSTPPCKYSIWRYMVKLSFLSLKATLMCLIKGKRDRRKRRGLQFLWTSWDCSVTRLLSFWLVLKYTNLLKQGLSTLYFV